MNYPNKINKQYHKEISYGNRGMDLENIINKTNEYLLSKDIALIYKKPTPIGVVKVSYENNKQYITTDYTEENILNLMLKILNQKHHFQSAMFIIIK